MKQVRFLIKLWDQVRNLINCVKGIVRNIVNNLDCLVT